MTDEVRYFRRVIKMRAEDSPNVRYGLARRAKGLPDAEPIIPGVLSLSEYEVRRATWDKIRQCIGLDGEFYEGAELLLFPSDWLNRAHEVARGLAGKVRKAVAIGIDPAEGGDETAMAAVDLFGVIEITSRKTPNTAQITGEAIAFMRKHGVASDYCVIDRGGGGKQHADRLREMGFPVRTLAFGESVSLEPKRGMVLIEEKKENREDRYVFVNRRAEMYHILSQLLDPAMGDGFGLPAEYTILRSELAPIPKLMDDEGRYWLPSKGSITEQMEKRNVKTLIDIIGHSPDHADAVVLAVWRMLYAPRRAKAGAI